MPEPTTENPPPVETSNDVAIIDRIQWVQVITANTRASAAFYAKFLGWKAADECDFTDMWTEVKSNKPNTTSISFHVEKDAAQKSGTIVINVVTKDLPKFHDRVKNLEGVQVRQDPIRQPWGGFTALYTLPDGVEFSVLNDWPQHGDNQTGVDSTKEEKIVDEAEGTKKETGDSSIVDRIRWVQVDSANNKESVALYAKFLGWKAHDEYEFTNIWTEVKSSNPNSTNISFHGEKKGEVHKPGRLSLPVVTKDLVKFHDRVKGIDGVKVVLEPTHQPWGGFNAIYAAPDGIEISVLNEWSDSGSS